MRELILIAAASKNNVIGLNGKIPWHIPEDLRRFKDLTLENSIIMGRKTFESIGKPLINRENIVLTSRKDYCSEGIIISDSIEKSLALASKEKIYVIGGEQIYRQFMPIANTLELTRVHHIYEGDAFFPRINSKEWLLSKNDRRKEYSFLTYTRK